MSSPPPKHSLSSPTSGNASQQVLPTPSSSTSVSLRQLNHNKQSQMRQDLEQQLKDKQQQLQESNSGIGKNVLARQVSQLQDRLKEMDSNISNEELQPTSSVDRLRTLERDLTSYRSHPLSPGISSIRNKEKLLNQRSPTHTTTSTSSTSLDPLPSPTTSTLLPPAHGHDSTSMLPLPPPPTGSTPTKRRSKIPNTDRRNTDIEFATEIGQGLLLEVRKMQALLQEKEEKLRTLENQKADLERAAEAMAKQMRQREENEEKLKEETWNLELAKQELVVSVTDLQTNLTKANAEQNKLAKQVHELRSEIEHLRDREEKLSATIDNMKQRHEQDMSSLRRHAAGIQREKSDQSKQIEALTSELAIAKAQSRIGKHASMEADASHRRAEKEQTDGDQAKSTLAVMNDSSPTSSPPSSPKQTPARNQALEVDTLKTSLAHAHRIISNLRSSFHKEKTEKFEFKKLLAESQETIEQLQNDPRMWVDAGPARSTGGSSSTANLKAEDGQFGARRPHKASTSSSSKRRGKKALDPKRSTSSKMVKSRATGDNDSVYSYTSMSDNDDSELDSFDESDADAFSNKASKKAPAIGFMPLSSELSQSQAQKPVVVDAQMNTDSIDQLQSLATMANSGTSAAPRSLGDELGMAMSRSPSSTVEKEASTTTDSAKSVAGGLVAGAAAALGLGAIFNSNDQKAGIEISTQTEEPPKPIANEIYTQTDAHELDQVTIEAISVEPKSKVTLQDATLNSADMEPEDPSIAANALAAAIAESRKAALHAAVDQQVQSEPEDPSIAEAALATAILASREKALQSSVDQETQSEAEDPSIAKAAAASAVAASRKLALESAVSQEIQCEPEDPSIQQAAIASALVTSRNAALESAIDQGIQCDPEDPSIAEAKLTGAILASRKKALDSAVHQETQSETEDPSIADAAIAATTAAAIASARLASIESGIQQGTQCDPEDPSIAIAATAAAIAASRKEAIESAISQETQFDPVAVVDHEIQCESVTGTDCGVQSQVETVDVSVQIDPVETKDTDVQHEAIETADASVQHEESEEELELAAAALAASTLANKELAAQQNSIGTQSEDAQTSDESTQCEAAAKLDHETQYDIPFGIDHSTQSAVAETLECGVQSDEPATANAVEVKDAQVQYEEPAASPTNTILPVPVVTSGKGIIAEDADEEFFDASAESKPASQNSLGNTAVLDNAKPTSRGITSEHKHNVATVDKAVSEKLYTKAETDALIASAVAAAIASAAALQQKSAADISGADDFENDPKRHTCDMSLNSNSNISTAPKRDTDSAVASHSSGIASGDDEELASEEDYGNVVVHLPREEDTITSSPYHEKRQQQRELEGWTALGHHEQAPRNMEAEQQGPTYRASELSLGPLITHEKEPDELSTGEHEDGKEDRILDIPVRPANPPPAALLSRAALSPTFNERAMSQVSVPSSKGKAPYDSQSHLSSPTNDDIQPTSSRLDFIKRGSVSASSMSTSNTNEQLQSITSSQYDPSRRASTGAGTTDPSTINLVTQTMIGDWMYKYTRKAVGGGLSENRHQRYFWIHPYTNTLYWSRSGPGGNGNGHEAKAKCALIEDITAVPDYTSNANGLPNVSLLIQTSQRQIKLTAPTVEKHDRWLESISYLIARNTNGTNTGLTLLSDSNKRADNTVANRSISSANSGSLLNRPGLRRIHDVFQQPSVSTSAPSMTTSTGDDHIDLDEDDEALEDVRMCCNGKHHVSKLEKDHTHRHQYRKRKSQHSKTGNPIATMG
ncbi:hypothetical protein BD408DRAFT_412470 [Parasitella parasitica]|nr:hypothetical protein BD408DRAFT_412470 [Parasitella parasitica]